MRQDKILALFRLALLVSWFVATSVAIGPAATAQILFTDDFEDGDTSAWTTFRSGWIESDGVYHATNTGGNIPVEAVVSSGLGWSDYTALVDVRPLSQHSPVATGVHFRWNEKTLDPNQSFAECSLFNGFVNGQQARRLRLYARGPGQHEELGEFLFPWVANTTYPIRVTAIDNILSCELEGVSGSRIVATSQIIQPSGTVGLRSTHIQSDFDNLIVVDLSAPVLTCLGFGQPAAVSPLTVRSNRVLPLKAELIDELGAELTDLDLLAPPVLQILYQAGSGGTPVDVTADALPAGQGTEGNQFEYSDDRWRYNLKTKNYSASGSYFVSMESGDPSEYQINPTCSVELIVD